MHHIIVATLLVAVTSFGTYNIGLLASPILWHQYDPISLWTSSVKMALPRSYPSPSTSIDITEFSSLERLMLQERPVSPPTRPGWKDDETMSVPSKHLATCQHFEAIKNELLVHPVLLAHANPKVIVVVPTTSIAMNPEGLLQEVKRHNTVETAIILDDQKNELKRLQNEDRSVDVVLVDGLPAPTLSQTKDENPSPLSPALAKLWHSLLVSNNKDHDQNSGMLAIRLDNRRDLYPVASILAAAGFARIIDYSWNNSSRSKDVVLVAFTGDGIVAPWHLNEALWNMRLQSRVKSSSSLIHFDAATMVSLEYPSKLSAVEYCRWNEKECSQDDQRYHGFDPFAWNLNKDLVTVGKSTAGEHAGRGVFTTTPVPQGSYMQLEVAAYPVRAHWMTTDIVIRLSDEYEIHEDYHPVYPYLDAYGFIDEPWGKPQYTVESGLGTFVNHGCDGTYNIGLHTGTLTEVSIDLENLPDKVLGTPYEKMLPYDPIEERCIHLHQIVLQNHILLQPGDELFDNYLPYGGNKYLDINVKDLRKECGGEFGFVEQLQSEKQESMEKKNKQQQQQQQGEELQKNTISLEQQQDDDNGVNIFILHDTSNETTAMICSGSNLNDNDYPSIAPKTWLQSTNLSLQIRTLEGDTFLPCPERRWGPRRNRHRNFMGGHFGLFLSELVGIGSCEKNRRRQAML